MHDDTFSMKEYKHLEKLRGGGSMSFYDFNRLGLYHLKEPQDLLRMYIVFGTIIVNVKRVLKDCSVCLCLQIQMCVLGSAPTIHRESSVRKGMVNSSCVQVSWLDLVICIHLHFVKQNYC